MQFGGNRAVRGEDHFRVTLEEVRFGQRRRHPQQRAGIACDNKPQAALLVTREIADRSVVIGGIENQKPAESRMIHDDCCLCCIAYHNRDNTVIELLRRRPLLANKGSVTRIDAHKIGFNTYCLKHCAHQVRFVFAIAVGLGEHLEG